MKWSWEERATEAVLAFLADTRVGCRPSLMAMIGPAEERGEASEGEGGSRARPRLCFSLPLFPLSSFFFLFLGGFGVWEIGEPSYDQVWVGDGSWSCF